MTNKPTRNDLNFISFLISKMRECENLSTLEVEYNFTTELYIFYTTEKRSGIRCELIRTGFDRPLENIIDYFIKLMSVEEMRHLLNCLIVSSLDLLADEDPKK